MSTGLESTISSRVEKAVANGEAKTILDKLQSITEKPETVQDLTVLFRSIDQSSGMIKFRKHWNQLPPPLQWILMHTTKGPNLISGTGPIQMLIKCGFINYKGHHQENPAEMENQIESMGGFEKLALKYGVKVGQHFVPELEAIEPYLEHIFRISKIANKLLTKVRSNLKELRNQDQNRSRNIKKISDEINQSTQQFQQLSAANETTVRPSLSASAASTDQSIANSTTDLSPDIVTAIELESETTRSNLIPFRPKQLPAATPKSPKNSFPQLKKAS